MQQENSTTMRYISIAKHGKIDTGIIVHVNLARIVKYYFTFVGFNIAIKRSIIIRISISENVDINASSFLVILLQKM